jgi:hypothetical protein
MTAKNVTIAPDLLERVRELAEVEGKTADQLVEEAALKLLETRRSVGELRSFVARNRQLAESQGFKESDVPRLIDEVRRAR